MEIALIPHVHTAPEPRNVEDLHALAQRLTGPLRPNEHADDTAALPALHIARRLAKPIQNVTQPGRKPLTPSELLMLKENADVISRVFPTKADQWTELSKLADTLARTQPKRASSPHEDAKTTVGTIAFDDSEPVKQLFTELYDQLESNRAPIGDWLSALSKNYLRPETPVIRSPEELYAHYKLRSQDETERTYHPISYEGKTVGLISFGKHEDKPGEWQPGEVQYWLGKAAGGKNVITNAVKIFERDIAKLYPNLNKIVGYVEDHNFASRQVFRKIGAKLTAFMLEPTPKSRLKTHPRLDAVEYFNVYHGQALTASRAKTKINAAMTELIG